MLILLGVSSIVPLERDELICTMQNNLGRSFEPMLRWSNGPPPMWRLHDGQQRSDQWFTLDHFSLKPRSGFTCPLSQLQKGQRNRLLRSWMISPTVLTQSTQCPKWSANIGRCQLHAQDANCDNQNMSKFEEPKKVFYIVKDSLWLKQWFWRIIFGLRLQKTKCKNAQVPKLKELFEKMYFFVFVAWGNL